MTGAQCVLRVVYVVNTKVSDIITVIILNEISTYDLKHKNELPTNVYEIYRLYRHYDFVSIPKL